jgi:Oxidoreductase NAD-binding domain
VCALHIVCAKVRFKILYPEVSGVQEIVATYPEQFRVDYALSREMQNKDGGKMYIQNKMEEYADELFDLLDNGAYIYFCGLKGVLRPPSGRAPLARFHSCWVSFAPCGRRKGGVVQQTSSALSGAVLGCLSDISIQIGPCIV